MPEQFTPMLTAILRTMPWPLAVAAVFAVLVSIWFVVDTALDYLADRRVRRQTNQRLRQCSGAANVVELRGWRVR